MTDQDIQSLLDKWVARERRLLDEVEDSDDPEIIEVSAAQLAECRRELQSSSGIENKETKS